MHLFDFVSTVIFGLSTDIFLYTVHLHRLLGVN